MVTELQPRVLRPAPDPLGSFIRPGYNDHVVIAQALTEGRGSGTGLVINPVHAERQLPLAAEARSAGVETVLDSKSLELSSPGGYVQSGIASLPWAGDGGMHSPFALLGAGGTQMVRALAEYAAEVQVSAVLAPTHFLDSATSPWWDIDLALTSSLRRMLDELEMTNTLIYYPWMIRASSLLDPTVMQRLIDQTHRLPIDGLWLRLHPFGTTESGPLALKRYLQLARQLHPLGMPLVAERSGTIGVALLAFGAVGGIESGVTFGDTVSLTSVLHPPKAGAQSFTPRPRVYLHELGAFVEHDVARGFFSKRGMKALHGCQDPTCCPRGWVDQVTNPRMHFLRQRSREVAELSAMPSSLRAGHYMEKFLRPASDRAMRAAELEPSLGTVRKRLDSWRGTLGADLEIMASQTVSQPAAGRRLRVRPSA